MHLRAVRDSVRFGIVIPPVTRQITLPAPKAHLVPTQNSAAARRDEALVEVDQMRIVRRRPLRAADAVRVVTNRARRGLAGDVPVVLAARPVAEDDASVVALVAERVVGIPLLDALLAEQGAAVFAVLADLTSDGSGTAETKSNRHNVTLGVASDRLGQRPQKLRTLAPHCTLLPTTAYGVPPKLSLLS